MNDETKLRRMVDQAGGIWNGLQETIRGEFVMFTHRDTHDTMVVSREGISVEAIREKLEASARRFTEGKLMDWEEQQKAIDDAIALFPPTFGLRGFPGVTFRISKPYSYMERTRANGAWRESVMLYAEKRFPGGDWLSWAKGTIEEFQREVIS